MLDNRVGSEKDLLLVKADAFVHKVYKTTKTFPKEELYGLTSQLRRAALSIPLNIIEGYARVSRQDHRRFLEISLGSTKESKYLVYFAFSQKLLASDDKEILLNDGDEISKMLWRKIETLRKSK